MIKSDRLFVVANTLPLYLLTQMFFDGDQVNETGIISMTKNIFEVISEHLNNMKKNFNNI